MFAALIGSAGSAAAQNNHMCDESVTFTDHKGVHGLESLGPQKQVSGTTIEKAASDCHDDTWKSFSSNAAWFDPSNVCQAYAGHPDQWGRTFTGDERTVWAIDKFADINNGYNRVSAYTVKCDNGKVVGTAPTPVYKLKGPPNPPF